jgi:hypothetical protein
MSLKYKFLTGKEVAHELFKIHHHIPDHDAIYLNGERINLIRPGIIYREEYLLKLFEKWGIPQPDWEANAKDYE